MRRAALRLPKVAEFPVVAIVTYSILSVVVLPPIQTHLVLLDTTAEFAKLFPLKVPNVMELPVVAKVKYSI